MAVKAEACFLCNYEDDLHFWLAPTLKEANHYAVNYLQRLLPDVYKLAHQQMKTISLATLVKEMQRVDTRLRKVLQVSILSLSALTVGLTYRGAYELHSLKASSTALQVALLEQALQHNFPNARVTFSGIPLDRETGFYDFRIYDLGVYASVEYLAYNHQYQVSLLNDDGTCDRNQQFTCTSLEQVITQIRLLRQGNEKTRQTYGRISELLTEANGVLLEQGYGEDPVATQKKFNQLKVLLAEASELLASEPVEPVGNLVELERWKRPLQRSVS